jgi:hypothetical protein
MRAVDIAKPMPLLAWLQDIESGFALEPADSGGVAGGGTGISPPPGPVIFPSLLNSVLQAQPQQQQQQGTAARAPPSAGGMRPGVRRWSDASDVHQPGYPNMCCGMTASGQYHH